MKYLGFVVHTLSISSYFLPVPSFAAEDTKLVRRRLVPEGGYCHHACDCDGYPDPNICCDKRDSTNAASNMGVLAPRVTIVVHRCVRKFAFLILIHKLMLAYAICCYHLITIGDLLHQAIKLS